jgi:hypothetical protein
MKRVGSRAMDFGYYQVGKEVFLNKVAALEHASKTHVVPTWHFNESIFDHHDWTVEPALSLEEIYKRRAEQLRAKYDYLVLFYSGGIDSHNILTTFIKNNIKLDAVVIYGTYEFDRDHSSNFNLELYNLAIPFAQQHKHLYDLKLFDISLLFDKYYHDDWIYESGVQLCPYEYVMGQIYREREINTWLEKGNTALIRGLDKPRVIFDQGQFHVGFLDVCVMQTPSGLLLDTNQISDHLELFYWSPDCPWLICKQAHIIKNYFKNHRPDLLHLLTHTKDFCYSTLTKYVVPLIYDVGVLPGQEPQYYNLGKTSSPVYHFKDQWFFSRPTGLSSQKTWQQGLEKIDALVDDRYKNSGALANGLSGLWSKWYCLGA